MMIGIELTIEGAPAVAECMKRNLLINCTQNTVIRLLPAMNLTERQAIEGCDIIKDMFEKGELKKLLEKESLV